MVFNQFTYYVFVKVFKQCFILFIIYLLISNESVLLLFTIICRSLATAEYGVEG
jgi:hypothetical protein